MSLLVLTLPLYAGCYLLGAIPFGFLVGRAHGVDIRKAGSGNIGATNVWRVLGAKWGIACFALDVAKGFLPTLAAGRLLAPASDGLTSFYLAWLSAAICCVLGHNFPVYLGFRGGKGVATSLGVVLGIYPYLTAAGLLAFAVWIVVTAATRYVSAGSVSAAIALPPILIGVLVTSQPDRWSGHWPLVAFSALAAGLVVYRHRANLVRLRNGTENRLGGTRKPSGADPTQAKAP